jgi:nucleoside recognition membrane protein YjiH
MCVSNTAVFICYFLIIVLWCCILFVVLTNKNGEVTITQTNIIIQLTTCFGPDRPPLGEKYTSDDGIL